MIRSSSRYFTHLESWFEPTSADSGATSMSWTMSEVMREVERAPLPFRLPVRGDRDIELLDARVTSDVAILLFGLTDRDASNPALRDVEANSSREIPKAPAEGVSCSAHLGLDLTPTADGFRHITLFEQAQVGRATMVRCLNKLFRTLPVGLETQKKRMSELHRRKFVFPSMEMRGELAKSLQRALEHGSCHGLEFVRTTNNKAVGVTEGQFTADKQTLRFRVSRDKKWFGKRWDGFLEMCGVAKTQRYEKVRVHFTDPDTTKKTTVQVDLEDEPEDCRFLRTTRERFPVALKQAPTQIVDSVASRMEDLIRAKRHGAESPRAAS